MKQLITKSVTIALLLLTACSTSSEESVAFQKTEEITREQAEHRKGGKALSAPAVESEMRTADKVGLSLGRTEKSSTEYAPVLAETFYTDAKFAKERYLAYTIKLNYISHDFAASRKTILNALEQYGYPVKSRVVITNNMPVQNCHFRIKTDSLYNALNILNDVGTLVGEEIDVVDYTNNVISLPERRMEDNREQQELPGEKHRDISRIPRIDIRDRVEWADITVTVTGTEPVVITPEKSPFTDALNHLLKQLILVATFLIRHLIPIAGITGIVLAIRKIVTGHVKKEK